MRKFRLGNAFRPKTALIYPQHVYPFHSAESLRQQWVNSSSKLHNLLDLPIGKLIALISFLAAPGLGLAGSRDAFGGHGSVVGVVDAGGGEFRLESVLRLALLLGQEELLTGGVILLLHFRGVLRLLHLLIRVRLQLHPHHHPPHPHPYTLLLLGQSGHLLPQGLILHLAIDQIQTKIAHFPLRISQFLGKGGLLAFCSPEVVLGHGEAVLDEDVVVLAFDDLLLEGTVPFLFHLHFEQEGSVAIL